MSRCREDGGGGGGVPHPKRLKLWTEKLSPIHYQALKFLAYFGENFSGKVSGDFVEIMRGFSLGSLDADDVAANMKKLFGKEEDLIREFNNFLPEGRKIDIEPPAIAADDVSFEDGVDFIRRVKARFADNDCVYKSFIKIIRMYKIKRSASEAERKVRELLQNYPDIYEEFLHYLPDGSDMEDEGIASDDTDSCNSSGVERKLLADGQYESEVRDVECKLKPSRRIANSNQTLARKKTNLASDNEKYFNNPQSEKILNQCEEDRFELDLLLCRVKAAIKQMEEFLKKLDKEPAQVRVKDHLNALSLRCIERLYGEHWLLVMDALHDNPRVVLPVLISRLTTKLEELQSCYLGFDKIWTEVVRRNYDKAVDHGNPKLKQ